MEYMIPKIIYLQIGDEVDLSFVDFKDLHKDAITWCEDKINVNDIEYINKEYSDQQNKNLLDEIDELKKLHTLGLQALLECQNEKNQLKSELKAADSVNEQLTENQIPEYLIEFVDDVKHMIKLYNNSSHTRSEEYRDKLAEKLDDIRTIDLKP